jgi:peptidoglycan glycosyltransferase
MNRQIRRVAAAVGVLMLALFLNLNYVQVVKGDAYRDNPANQRVILNEYSTPRGQIVVDGSPIAQSVPTKDELKFLRTYANGPEYAAITGYYSLVYGKDALEDLEDPILAGTDPRLLGNRITEILTGRDPKGGSVLLTLDSAAQDAAYKAMDGRRGAVVALDPTTGKILAVVSTPSYDPNALSSHNYDSIQSTWTALNANPAQPRLNRAFQQNYPPGSVFKVIVAAAALKAGIQPNQQIDAPNILVLPNTGGTTLSNYDNESCSPTGKQAMQDALAISCNTAFAGLGLQLGAQAITDEANLFGIDDTPRTVPLAVARSTVGPINSEGDLAHASIGQQSVRITALQAAMIAAAVANSGTLMKPYLVEQEKGPDLAVLSQTNPTELSQVLDPDLAGELAVMMHGVVANSDGTGRAADITDIPGVSVGGKTGTADTGVFVNGKQTAPHDWFIGFASRNGAPQIAVAVILENGAGSNNEATGGLTAAPVAKDVMEAYLSSLTSH